MKRLLASEDCECVNVKVKEDSELSQPEAAGPLLRLSIAAIAGFGSDCAVGCLNEQKIIAAQELSDYHSRSRCFEQAGGFT